MPFIATIPELLLVNAIFRAGDPDQTGVISGDRGVTLFSTTELSSSVLGQIWEIADKNNEGFLRRSSVLVFVRLLGWAQTGERVTPNLLQRSAWPSVSVTRLTFGSVILAGPLAIIDLATPELSNRQPGSENSQNSLWYFPNRGTRAERSDLAVFLTFPAPQKLCKQSHI